MRKRIELNRPSHAVVVAYLALFIALGGSAYAVSKLPKNSVGPKQIRKNSVNSAKVKNHSLLAEDFRAGQLPAGKEGPRGPKGDPATSLWAEVATDATLVRGSGVTGVKAISPGNYTVDFNRDISGCSPQATLAVGQGFIEAAPRSGDSAGVAIFTYTRD